MTNAGGRMNSNRIIRFVRSTTQFIPLCLLLFSFRCFANQVDVITVEDAITPVTAKLIGDAVKRAERTGAEALIIRLDTPGGLMEATWKIDKALLAAKVPVVVYITPSGGRAASAGVYISYAAHVVAMAPSTHIGAAHPVTMGGQDTSKTMAEKITNDAVAHIKGLAEKRGRNAAWAEESVRKSVSITEKEALQKHVIDLVAEDLGGLLDSLDGRRVNVDGRDETLHTRDAVVREFGMSWRYRLLDKISNPNIAYIFMILGIWGLYFELSNPGAILPGVAGGIFLILAFFAFQVLSINAAGLALILLSLVFFIVEVKVNSHGILAAGGIVSMFMGSVMLFNSPAVKVSISLILAVVFVSAAFFILVIRLAFLAHRRKPVTGKRGLMGEFGEALSSIDPAGKVAVHGEIWKAVSAESIKKGEMVQVIGVEGMVLRVESMHDQPVRGGKRR
jgi:membrane-bound serine protease (ClpP class)